MLIEHKFCSKCGEHKPFSEFNINNHVSGKLDTKCRTCSKADRQGKSCLDCGMKTAGTRCRSCHQHWNRGSNHPSFVTGKSVDGNGYLILTDKWDHPNANAGRIAEHRFVMSMKQGRALLDGEVVHHKNGDRQDNVPDNLELCWVQPPGQRVTDLIAYLESTGYEVRRANERRD